MRRLLSFGVLLLVFQLFAYTQTYRNITTVDGLKNNYVYSIAQDKDGFTWFLSSSGVDRFDGQDFIHFFLQTDYRPIGVSSQYQIIADKNGDIWQVGTRRGNSICKFDKKLGSFIYIPINGVSSNGIHFLFLDEQNRFWIANDNRIFIYDINTGTQEEIKQTFPSDVICGTELQNKDYIIGLDKGIVRLNKSSDKWNVKTIEADIEWKNSHDTFVSENVAKRFVPTHLSDISTRKMVSLKDDPNSVMIFDSKSHYYKTDINTGETKAYVIKAIHDTHITDIKQYFNNPNKWFVATEGRGVFLLDTKECCVTKYVSFDYNHNPGLRGNVTLNVLAEENGKRVWFANYPYGICCHNIHFPSFSHHISTSDDTKSISPGVVTEIMQDSEGDMWYATSSGISCHLKKSDTWKHYLRDTKRNNLTYLSVCEIRPGMVMASGLMSGGFIIYKYSDEVISINPQYFGSTSDADYNVRDTYKDDKGIIWLAGNEYLGRIDWDKKTYTAYPLSNPAMLITKKDKEHFWLVTVEDVYVVNINTAEKTLFTLPNECIDINDLLTTKTGETYIATADEGLFICKHNKQTDKYEFRQFVSSNCALLTNNIIAIAEDSNGNIAMSTDIGVTKYYPQKNTFVNWSHWQGMPAVGFYKKSALGTTDKEVLYGTYDGVISISDSVILPKVIGSKTIFSNLHINNSPRDLSHDFTHLELNHNERQIAFKVGNLNYDNPYIYLYSWKLETKNKVIYNRVTKSRHIRYLLKPGNYKLTVCTYNSTDYRLVEERSVTISIKPPVWQKATIIGIYLMVFFFTIFCIHIFVLYRNKRIIAEEKVNFFIRTAHEIRTPLSLIKAPLEEISNKEQLSETGYTNIQTVLRSANDLLILTGDLLNIERIKIRSTKLSLFHCYLNSYIQELISPFLLYAETKKIKLIYNPTNNDKVWIDRSRMDCILQNLINNAIKYTNSNGQITINSNISKINWTISISDTGIGIPESEKAKLTEMFYRSTNIKPSTDGTGVGLYLVNKLVEEHKGILTIDSKEGKGTVFTLKFPMDYEDQKNIIKLSDQEIHNKKPINDTKILIVEDNSELRRFLKQSLSEQFYIYTVENGDEAYNKVRFIQPDIIISDVMMPGMQGDELCRKIKSEIETSHIPVILLTARADEDSKIDGLSSLADAYITKPFSMDVLKASINNVIANRKILQDIINRKNAQKSEKENIWNEVKIDENKELNANNIDLEFIKSINNFINENIENNNFTVDTLCTLVGMSRTSFYNKLKSLTGWSPADFIRIHRIEKAKLLLINSNLNINDISDKCGFSDVKYFREVFKKNLDMSPIQYRNIKRKSKREYKDSE